jgi:hypothetical protein
MPDREALAPARTVEVRFPSGSIGDYMDDLVGATIPNIVPYATFWAFES